MDSTSTPTCENLYEGNGYESVLRETDATWRHGSYVTQVFRRIADGTFWRAEYRLSTDGETNELREGCAEIAQVWPVEKTVVAYETSAPPPPTKQPAAAPPWVRTDDFRGEPITEPLAWWYGQDGKIQLDEVLIGEDGTIEGKGGCGASYCTHIMLVRDDDLPAPPVGAKAQRQGGEG